MTRTSHVFSRAPRVRPWFHVLAVLAVIGALLVAVTSHSSDMPQAAAAPRVTSANLLPNGSYESTAPLPGGFGSGAQVSRSTGTGESGAHYARVAAGGSNASAPVGLVNQPITGQPKGAHLTATCYVRTNDYRLPAILRVSEVRSDGTTKKVERASTTAVASWTRLNITYTLTSSNSRIFIAVYSTGLTKANKDALAVDNCSIQRLSAVGPAPVAPAIPTSVPSGYTRAFTENFNQTAATGSFDSVYGSRFASYKGCCNTNRTTQYSSSKVLSASGGSLRYYLHSEYGQSYTAAVSPGPYMNFTYGQVGMSIRLDSSIGDGYKTAFLLWPKTDTWTNEVDFPEVYPDFSQRMYIASLQTTTVSGVHKFTGGPGSPSTVSFADNRYHTFLMTWKPGSITASIDGKVVQTITGSAVPTQPMHVVMQTEGWKDHGAVPVDSNARVEVPWVYINTRN